MRKKKQKPNATQRQLAADWEKLKARQASQLETGAKAKAVSSASKAASKIPMLVIPEERNSRTIASFDSGKGNAARPPDKHYTGSAMVGIAQMHKSNQVPVFNTEAAKDISKMRRG